MGTRTEHLVGVSNEDLARLLAERNRIPHVAAADQVDEVVHRILKKLRRGQGASLPGLGRFKPGKTTKFEFQKKATNKGAKRGRK